MKKSNGSIMITTLISFSIVSILCLTCLELMNTNNEISNINYKSIEMSNDIKSGSELTYSKILEEVNKAIQISIESENIKQTYIDYFTKENKFNFIQTIEDINELNIQVNVVSDKVYLEGSYIKFDVTYNKQIDKIKKNYRCSFKIDTNINIEEIDLAKLVDKYNYREI